jgi:hypothetical protein
MHHEYSEDRNSLKYYNTTRNQNCSFCDIMLQKKVHQKIDL